MIIPRFRLTLVALAAALAAACGRESPTAVGGALLPGGSVRTFEVVLDAPQFLVSDTAVAGFTRSSTTAFMMVAENFGGSVTAHTLARFVQPGPTISVLDSTKTTRTDTLPRYFSGTVFLTVDTTAVNGTTPVVFRLYRTTEKWDAYSASWTMRVDSGSTHLPWSQAGGTRGALVDSLVWNPVGATTDTIKFRVDSATVAAWADTSNAARGALITAATSGSRVRFSTIGYTVSAHSSIRADTTVLVTPGVEAATFIYNPQLTAPPAGILRVGGVPSWRSFLTFAPDLETRTLSCPASSGLSCSFTLKSASINFAGLLLQPAPTGAFLPEDSVRVSAWVSDTSSLVPLSRAPLGSQVGTTLPAVVPSRFAGTPTGSPVAVPITSFVAALAGDTTLVAASSAATRRLALLHVPEPGLFGVAAFYGRAAGAQAPKLRLVVTVATEAQLP